MGRGRSGFESRPGLGAPTMTTKRLTPGGVESSPTANNTNMMNTTFPCGPPNHSHALQAGGVREVISDTLSETVGCPGGDSENGLGVARAAGSFVDEGAKAQAAAVVDADSAMGRLPSLFAGGVPSSTLGYWQKIAPGALVPKGTRPHIIPLPLYQYQWPDDGRGPGSPVKDVCRACYAEWDTDAWGVAIPNCVSCFASASCGGKVDDVLGGVTDRQEMLEWRMSCGCLDCADRRPWVRGRSSSSLANTMRGHLAVLMDRRPGSVPSKNPWDMVLEDHLFSQEMFMHANIWDAAVVAGYRATEEVEHSCAIREHVLYSCRLRDVHPPVCRPVWGSVWARANVDGPWRAAILKDTWLNAAGCREYLVIWLGSAMLVQRRRGLVFELSDILHFGSSGSRDGSRGPVRALCVFRHRHSYFHPVTGIGTREAAWSTLLVLGKLFPPGTLKPFFFPHACLYAGVIDLRLFGPQFKLTKSPYCSCGLCHRSLSDRQNCVPCRQGKSAALLGQARGRVSRKRCFGGLETWDMLTTWVDPHRSGVGYPVLGPREAILELQLMWKMDMVDGAH